MSAEETPVFATLPPSDPPPEYEAPSMPPLPLLLLDHSNALSAEKKPEFLYWLRMALLYHGSFYLINTGIPEDLFDETSRAAADLFKVDPSEKQRCSVSNSSGFTGWAGIAENEYRETWEFASELPGSDEAKRPAAARIRSSGNQYPTSGPASSSSAGAQGPDLSNLPQTIKAFQKFLRDLAFTYNELVAEALGLPSGSFDSLFDQNAAAQGRIKFSRYFHGEDPAVLGEGPYRDAWLSFTLFANDVPGIEIRSERGQTLQIPPLPSALLVQTGTALSFATHQAVLSLPHRVIQPATAAEAALTVRFRMEISPDVKFKDLLDGVVDLNNCQETPQWSPWLLERVKQRSSGKTTRSLGESHRNRW
ncbi:uncharacterized protein EV422DRAFT_312980 [Fimicolochytrium jonesii]|uniref:uncharacterized protein n=1 Tax=Fimicolochytrium jonesii TaxID=1396493 RepID=UPI0022FEC244|nr:uncharacterized protein EV422DRAFT_312980 [Fimicolochytrium jonesii]KAI8824256.1 hypothetical protein EV422DRAFT_312980 [Fimicolochytrium jonesii]